VKAGERRGLDALFLDRDGTLIVERGFLGDPSGVRLARGAATRLARITSRGTLLFVVTNQSGLARGRLSWAEVHAVNAETARRLARAGVSVTEFLVCPHHPEGSVPELSRRCGCRKPGTLLFRRAARRHGLAPERCAVVGDKWDDVGAALAFGATAAHVLTGYGRAHRPKVREKAPGAILATSLADALDRLEDAFAAPLSNRR
jgi:D-glycero-D-manno-heptose 1,7-bisphosphate phosphatase